MPDSTSKIGLAGLRDAPVIQFDDMADFTDAYALLDFGSEGDRNGVITDLASNSLGISPNDYRFDDLATSKISLSQTDRDTTIGCGGGTSDLLGAVIDIPNPHPRRSEDGAGFPNGRRGDDEDLRVQPDSNPLASEASEASVFDPDDPEELGDGELFL